MWFPNRFSSFSAHNLFSSNKNPPEQKHVRKTKLKVGILGTGKIGTDLLMKVEKSTSLCCVMFSGRNLQSEGMLFGVRRGVAISDKGIDAFRDPSLGCDLVFDCTSAAYHLEHHHIFRELGIFAVDMTPSQVGECIVPAIGLDDIALHHNISMISCGGQCSTPVAYALTRAIPGIQHFHVTSTVSANSIGPGTLANIAEYRTNTEAGLRKYTGVAKYNIELMVDKVNLETKMITQVEAKAKHVNLKKVNAHIETMVKRVQAYVPGYHITIAPALTDAGVSLEIGVEGAGDFLPRYAGNLDIINCAAIAVAEKYAALRNRSLQNDTDTNKSAELAMA